MRFSKLLIAILGGFSLLTSIYAAAGEIAELAFHRRCDPNTPEPQRLLLPYWSKEIARRANESREPVCVLRQPALSGLSLKSTRIDADPYGPGAVAVIEFKDDARAAIERMSQENAGKFVAFVVNDRIVAMPFISQRYSDDKVVVHTPSRAEAENILVAVGLKPSSTAERANEQSAVSAKPDNQNNGAFQELKGSWSVIGLTANGLARGEPELSNSIWRFQGNELTQIIDNKEKERFALKMDVGAQPKAFQVTPLPPSRWPPGWMIFAREGSRLKIAFHDNLKKRPQSFEDREDLIVLTFLPRETAELNRREALAKGRDPCSILVAAGVRELLGDHFEQRKRETPEAGPNCEYMGLTAIVGLMLIPATNKISLERERENFLKDTRNAIKDEPELGELAFSVSSLGRTIMVAIKGDTLIMIPVKGANAKPDLLRPFAKRVLAKL